MSRVKRNYSVYTEFQGGFMQKNTKRALILTMTVKKKASPKGSSGLQKRLNKAVLALKSLKRIYPLARLVYPFLCDRLDKVGVAAHSHGGGKGESVGTVGV